ncbi:hypothetical protein JTB14_018162 [Gonioctena quinquepunctata]|nr:hypothetical protein JTB14_018162 [Gonioctena quinquepunctata]
MLNDKIDQLKNVEEVSTTNTAESKKVMEKVSYAKKTQQPINEPATSRGVAGCAKIPEVTEKQLSCVLLETETRKKCNDYINLANHNEVATDHGEWKQVVKKKTRRQLVVGQNNSIKINGKEMKGIPKMTHLHVYRVDPTMTDYGDILYGSASKQLFQNTALRLCAGAMNSTPVDSLRVEALEPPLEIRRTFLSKKSIVKEEIKKSGTIKDISQLNTEDLTNIFWSIKNIR